MNPITNSRIKEAMRQQNETIALNREHELNKGRKRNYSLIGFVIGGGILGIVFAATGGGGTGFLIGLAVGIIVRSALNQGIKRANENLDAEIREEYKRADRRTQQEIETYDREVKAHAQRILSKSDSIAPMVDHAANMFQRMISHANAGAHMRFIEADLIYEVSTTGIQYSYQSKYTNPQDDYNFNVQRFRDLQSAAECEGLAQALAKLIVVKMKTLYPPNSLGISLSHNDALVTLHFKGANKQFVPAKDIL